MGMMEELDHAQNELKSWRPEVAGERLVGTLLGSWDIETEFGTAHFIDLLNEQDGDKIAVLCRTVLWRLVQQKKPQPGDTVGIKYLGKKGRYHDYVMLVQKGGEEVPF